MAGSFSAAEARRRLRLAETVLPGTGLTGQAPTRMEQALTRTAAENDQDFLTRTATRWIDTIDQDGTEPTETELHHRQGAFLRRPHRGLHHLTSMPPTTKSKTCSPP